VLPKGQRRSARCSAKRNRTLVPLKDQKHTLQFKHYEGRKAARCYAPRGAGRCAHPLCYSKQPLWLNLPKNQFKSQIKNIYASRCFAPKGAAREQKQVAGYAPA